MPFTNRFTGEQKCFIIIFFLPLNVIHVLWGLHAWVNSLDIIYIYELMVKLSRIYKKIYYFFLFFYSTPKFSFEKSKEFFAVTLLFILVLRNEINISIVSFMYKFTLICNNNIGKKNNLKNKYTTRFLTKTNFCFKL